MNSIVVCSRVCSVRVLRVLGFMGALFALQGCRQQATSANDTVDRLDALYQQYLTGSVYQAREAMLEAVKLVSEIESEEGRATGLCLGYGRLFCIEDSVGNADLAYIYYEKSKYWGLIRMELRGASPAELKAGLEDYTPERCRELIVKFDAAHTEGLGPRYMRE